MLAVTGKHFDPPCGVHGSSVSGDLLGVMILSNGREDERFTVYSETNISLVVISVRLWLVFKQEEMLLTERGE